MKVTSMREALDLLVDSGEARGPAVTRKLRERVLERCMPPGAEGYNVFISEAMEIIQLCEELLNTISTLSTGMPASTFTDPETVQEVEILEEGAPRPRGYPRQTGRAGFLHASIYIH